jgi:hypothetical protein
VVKHGARRHGVEVPGRDWPGNHVAPTQLQVRHIGLGQRKIEIHRHGCAVGRYPPREPLRHCLPAANLERPRPRPDAKLLHVAAMHLQLGGELLAATFTCEARLFPLWEKPEQVGGQIPGCTDVVQNVGDDRVVVERVADRREHIERVRYQPVPATAG